MYDMPYQIMLFITFEGQRIKGTAAIIILMQKAQQSLL